MVNTYKKILLKNQYIFLSLILISTSALFGCGATYYHQHDDYTSVRSDEGKTSVSFETRENGKTIRWKAVFRDDDLTALYKNGKRIPRHELNKYEDMVEYRLDKLRGDDKSYSFHFKGFDNDMFKEKMKEFKKNFKMHKHNWDFDKDEFEKDMENLKEELSKLKNLDIKAEFDEEEFQNNMQELRKSLKNMRIKIPKIHIDMDGAKHTIRIPRHLCDDEFALDDIDIDIPDINIPDIDIPEINVDLSGLEESMKELDYNMKDLDVEMKKLDAFITEMKEELVNDKLIKDVDDDNKIKLSKDKMEVNGEKVSDELHLKYKQMYKKHFDKELDDDNQFNIN